MTTAQSTELSADVCVVGGAGHVGLPLALVFANRGLRVVAYDINEEALETVRTGRVPHRERGPQELLVRALESKHLTLSSDPAVVGEASTIILTIGTPIDEFLNPVFKVVKECVDGFLPYLTRGQLLVIRSTVYPGTTDWLYNYLASRDCEVKVAFCPERVAQGHAIEEIQKLPQIVSGSTPEAEQNATKLFRSITSEIVSLSPIEAEFAKLLNNAYRYIQFAIANQFYMMTSSAGVDYYRVLEGMQRNYPRARDLPNAGFTAGPCLFKDTMQLAAFVNHNFSLGHEAMLVNEGLVLHVVKAISKSYDLSQLTVGLLGMAFKADSDDIRSSLAYKLKKLLDFRAKEVLTTDPFVTVDPDLLPVQEVVERSALLILCAPHSTYRDLDYQETPVFDVWNFLGKSTLI